MPDGATVLDLGCGDGDLLAELIASKHVRGSGVEISQAAVEACVARGLSVFHGDLDEGLADYQDGSFDVVILSFSLQQLRRPRLVVREMARVGRQVIVSFPNFAHWSIRAAARRARTHAGEQRAALSVVGHAQHPPLHASHDFRALCREEGLRIEQRALPAHVRASGAPSCACPT